MTSGTPCYYVDSNVFIQAFARDDLAQQAQAEALFRRAAKGELELYCGPPVFFEIAWVLGKVYRLKNGEILDILESILSAPSLKVADRDLVMRAIIIARSRGTGFADSYIAAGAQLYGMGIASFNRRHFEKFETELYPLAGDEDEE